MQQDAEECWSNVLYALKESLRSGDEPMDTQASPPSASISSSSAIERLFGVRLSARLECAETGESVEETSTAYSLKCNISADVNHLVEGIRLGLREDRERTSAALGRWVNL